MNSRLSGILSNEGKAVDAALVQSSPVPTTQATSGNNASTLLSIFGDKCVSTAHRQARLLRNVALA